MKIFFTNIDQTLKKLSKILFYVFLIAGLVMVVYGLISLVFIDGGFSRREMQSTYIMLFGGLGVMISAFMVLPLYALGELVSLGKDIRANTADPAKTTEEN